MGKRGPKPTPTKTLRLRGARNLSVRDGEPLPAEGEMVAPEWVGDEARKHWFSLAPMLNGMGLSSPSFTPALAMLVNSLGRYIEYEAKVSETGPVVETDKGNLLVNPWWAARNKAWEQALKALREFGLTPSSLTGVRKVDDGGSNSDKSRFFDAS